MSAYQYRENDSLLIFDAVAVFVKNNQHCVEFQIFLIFKNFLFKIETLH